jgi:hypothetical protein
MAVQVELRPSSQAHARAVMQATKDNADRQMQAAIQNINSGALLAMYQAGYARCMEDHNLTIEEVTNGSL